MSFSNTSVVPRITLSPVVGTWSALFAGYHAYLNLRAGFSRSASKKYLGTSGVPEDSEQLIHNRSFGNFTENVPLALILAGICEVNGGSKRGLNGVLAFLFAVRIAHAEFGLKAPGHVAKLEKDGFQIGRLSGFLGTNAVILSLGAYALSLSLPAFRTIFGI